MSASLFDDGVAPTRASAPLAVRMRPRSLDELVGQELQRARVAARLRALGTRSLPSAGNFLLVHFGSVEKAKEADAFLTQRGLILRSVASYGLPAALRLTVGTEEANEAVVAALADFVK